MEKRDNRLSNWTRLKILGGIATIAFSITLAAIVGNRLSDEALAVLAGAVCGVGAAIPTSLLVIAVTQRRREEQRRVPYPSAQPPGAYPPVVVVTPQQMPPQAHQWSAFPPSLNGPAQRTFTVVGGATLDEEGSCERYY